jgi:RHS repeat-associated protein
VTYDPANRQLTFDTTQLTYDANGNLTSDGTKSYHWDARNRLIGISGSGLTASFQYDALTRRSTRVVNGVSTAFLYNGVNPVQELSGTSVTANMLSGLGVDEYFTRTDARGTHTLLTDPLGSTLALTDNAGIVTSSYTYEPYGKTTTTGTTNLNPFQYTGRENDGTGLYYYRARYYLPSTQRFISEDPLNFLGGDTNLYGYVLNDPVNLIDPEGKGPVGLIGMAACLVYAGYDAYNTYQSTKQTLNTISAIGNANAQLGDIMNSPKSCSADIKEAADSIASNNQQIVDPGAKYANDVASGYAQAAAIAVFCAAIAAF